MESGPGNTFSAKNKKKTQKIPDFRPKKGGGHFLTPPPPPTSLMFELIRATQPLHNMRERMRQRQTCVLCIVKSAPPLQFVVSARSIIVLNVLTPTLVEIILLVRHMGSDMR